MTGALSAPPPIPALQGIRDLAGLRALPGILRAALRPLLPEGASLRRARDGWLFVSNAPVQCRDAAPDRFISLSQSLNRLGLHGEIRFPALLLRPSADFARALEAQFPEAPNFFCASLMQTRGFAPDERSLALLAAGLRLLEQSDANELRAFDRRVRALAAVSLRQRTGGAYACALVAGALNHPKTPI